jgi:hypothetical protein
MYVLLLVAITALNIETQFGVAPDGKFLQKLLGSIQAPLGLWFGRHILRIPTFQAERFGAGTCV